MILNSFHYFFFLVTWAYHYFPYELADVVVGAAADGAEGAWDCDKVTCHLPDEPLYLTAATISSSVEYAWIVLKDDQTYPVDTGSHHVWPTP